MQNTKICLSAIPPPPASIFRTGCGGSPAHGVFENWVEFCRDNYMGINDRNEIEWMTTYYDPLENFKVNAPGAAGAGAGTAFHLLPQSPELATQIYEALVESLGWRDPRREIGASTPGLIMARALGDNTVIERLTAAAERHTTALVRRRMDVSAGGSI